MDPCKLIVFGILQSRFLGAIKEAVIVEGNDSEPYLVYTLGNTKGGCFKTKLSEVLSDSVESMHLSYVATQMLREGYLYVPIEGGELVISPQGEEYQIDGKDCSCPSQEAPCKHLQLRDWYLQQREKAANYRATMS